MIHFFEPGELTFGHAKDGTLQVQIGREGTAVAVEVLRAFPLSHPTTNLVLRDKDGTELGVIPDMAGLSAANRALVDEALDRRYFLPKITAIHSIYERFGSSVWEVDTDRGPVSIQTKAMHESISEIGPGRFLLKDNEENRYEIPSLHTLDENSRLRFLGKV